MTRPMSHLPRAVFLLALAGCAAPPPAPLIRTVTRYGGGDAAPLEIPASRLQREERTPEVIVGRYEAGEGRIALGPPAEDPIAKRAYRLGALAQLAVRAELSLQGGIGLVVLLVDDSQFAARTIGAELPADRGMAFGLPVQASGISAEHASAFVYNVAHQATVQWLTVPEMGRGCALYRRDPRVRWFGEGVASLVGVRALAAAVKDGADLAPLGYTTFLEEAERRGITTVSLAEWQPRGMSDAPLTADEVFQERLRRATAAYCCQKWYSGLTSRGVGRPLTELMVWLRGFPLGPTHDDLGSWLLRSGGFDINSIDRVPLALVREFHVNLWRTLKWKLPTPAAGAPASK